jgi:hypothetical protein
MPVVALRKLCNIESIYNRHHAQFNRYGSHFNHEQPFSNTEGKFCLKTVETNGFMVDHREDFQQELARIIDQAKLDKDIHKQVARIE